MNLYDAVVLRGTIIDETTVKSNIKNSYFTSIEPNNVGGMISKGKKIIFSAADNPNNISIVLFGEFTNGKSSVEVSKEGTYVEMEVPNEFISFETLELRVNRLSTRFTDTETIISNLRLTII